MLENAACLGVPHLLDTVNGQNELLNEYCPSCSVKRKCLELGLSYMDQLSDGYPIAWFIYGGVTPEQLELLWIQTQGYTVELVCWVCGQQTHPIDWSIEEQICTHCYKKKT